MEADIIIGMIRSSPVSSIILLIFAFAFFAFVAIGVFFKGVGPVWPDKTNKEGK